MPLQLREYQKNDFIALKNIIRKTWRYDGIQPKNRVQAGRRIFEQLSDQLHSPGWPVLNGKPVGIILVKDIARHTCPLPNRFRSFGPFCRSISPRAGPYPKF